MAKALLDMQGKYRARYLFEKVEMGDLYIR